MRNIELRAPYMHDGSLATLREVIEHYNGGFTDRPGISALMPQLMLSDDEIDALLDFLLTLTSHDEVATPRLPGI